ncbi:MAG: hypothetical protein L0I24_01285, partial [Pseudonocardia sp.]|nr:hypothetical protein [Pseudonocardia sp.]
PDSAPPVSGPIDPETGRLAGVLDITCLSEDASALLRPFLVRGARDVEERLLGDVRRAHRSVLDAFGAATLRSAEPVVAFGTDLVLSNDAASDLLQPVDQVAMHVLATGLTGPAGTTRRCELDLAAGFRASLQLSLVDGGVVVRVATPAPAVPVPRGGRARLGTGVADWHAPLQAEIDRFRAEGVSVVVGGEPGTGRRTVARRLALCPS